MLAQGDHVIARHRAWLRRYSARCLERWSWVRGPRGWQIRDVSFSTNAAWRGTSPVSQAEAVASLREVCETLEATP